MSLTREEQETILSTTEADETWKVYTASRRIAALFRRRGWPMAEIHGGWEAEIPFGAITVRSMGSLSRPESLHPNRAKVEALARARLRKAQLRDAARLTGTANA